MTHTEKADELIEKFRSVIQTWDGTNDCEIPERVIIKDCAQAALIAVEEIMKVIPMYTGNLNPNWSYWLSVKQHLITKIG